MGTQYSVVENFGNESCREYGFPHEQHAILRAKDLSLWENTDSVDVIKHIDGAEYVIGAAIEGDFEYS